MTWCTASTSCGSIGRTAGDGIDKTLESRRHDARVRDIPHAGRQLAYTSYGEGPRLTVLLHGLLFNQRMHDELARALADRGHRVVTLDLLGHGASDRPTDMWNYSMSEFGREVVALLDHLEVEEAVVMGSSLGANAALEAASLAPERLRGMVVEMPVLDNALPGAAVAFTPLLLALTFGAPAMRALSRFTRLLPSRGVPWQIDILLDWVRQDPGPERGSHPGPLLRAHRTAPGGAPYVPDADARDRAPARHRSTRSRMPGCSPTSSRTGGCCWRTRSSSCA